MTAGLLLSFVVSFAIGWLIVALLWLEKPRASAARRLVRMFLAFGIGQGITSCVAFLYLVVHGSASGSYHWVEVALLAVLLLIFAVTRRYRTSPEARAEISQPPPSHTLLGSALLPAAFYTTAAMALATVALRLWQQPHGGYDAWVIWNARARAIFRGGEAWRDDIYGVVVGHVHLDYPLLLPVGVVRTWMYAGGESTVGPALLAWLFTGATLGLLTSAVAALCGRVHAYIAGLVLLGYTFFVLHANSQLAEAPLIYFYVAAFVLVAFHNAGATSGRRLLVLAGLAGGLAAWTKNEGLLFLVALGIAHFAVVASTLDSRSYARQALALATGLAPIAAVILYFKTQLAPPNVWIAEMSTPVVAAQATDAGRYVAIARTFAERLILYSGPGINIGYLLILLLVCFGVTRRHLPTVVQAALTLTIMFAGFIAVYLLTVPNVTGFMSGSIDRLLLQLWPVFVFTFFLLAAPVDLRMAASGQPREALPAARDAS
jgi:hypothetical protein